MTTEKLTLNIPEVCEKLDISEPTLRKAMKAGKIPYLRIGSRRIVFPITGINKYLDSVGAGSCL